MNGNKSFGHREKRKEKQKGQEESQKVGRGARGVCALPGAFDRCRQCSPRPGADQKVSAETRRARRESTAKHAPRGDAASLGLIQERSSPRLPQGFLCGRWTEDNPATRPPARKWVVRFMRATRAGAKATLSGARRLQPEPRCPKRTQAYESALLSSRSPFCFSFRLSLCPKRLIDPTLTQGTGSIGARPDSTALTLASARRPMASRVSTVALPICGVRKTLGSSASRVSKAGSCAKTSSPAANN